MSISTKTENQVIFNGLKTVMVFAALLILAQGGAPARANTFDITKIPSLKTYETLPEKEFESAGTLEREERPYDDTLLAYELRVPKGWTNNVQGSGEKGALKDKTLSNTFLAILGRYVGPPENLLRSYITVEAMAMDYEIGAVHWFVNFIIRSGYTLSGMDVRSAREVEALYVEVIKDQSYVVRTKLFMNGPRLILIRHYQPAENYEESDKIEQLQIIKSFRLLNVSDERIEKQKTFGFLDQSYFNYPVSWELLEKPIVSIERMTALVFQGREGEKKEAGRKRNVKKNEVILEGHIKINAISRLLDTTLAKEIEDFRTNLKIPGYSIGTLIENVSYTYDPSIKVGKAQVYKLVPDDPVTMKDYEMVVTVMQGDDYYYITNMTTPSREQDFYAWARNMEAAKIINESVRRFEKPMVVDPNDPYYDYLKEAQ